MTTPSDDRQGQARKITPETKLEFPCWVYRATNDVGWWKATNASGWFSDIQRVIDGGYTYHHPDQPEKPAEIPTAAPSTPSPGALPTTQAVEVAEWAVEAAKDAAETWFGNNGRKDGPVIQELAKRIWKRSLASGSRPEAGALREARFVHAVRQMLDGGPFDLQDSPRSFMSNVKKLLTEWDALSTLLPAKEEKP